MVAWPETRGTLDATVVPPSVKVTRPLGAEPAVTLATTLAEEALALVTVTVVWVLTTEVTKLLVAVSVATPQTPPADCELSWRKPDASMRAVAAGVQRKPVAPV